MLFYPFILYFSVLRNQWNLEREVILFYICYCHSYKKKEMVSTVSDFYISKRIFIVQAFPVVLLIQPESIHKTDTFCSLFTEKNMV